jgi:hypothetical protein
MTFLRFYYPDPEHTLLAKREQVLRLASSHHWPVLLYFHVTAVGAQTALPLVALRPPPLQVRERPCASYLPAQGFVGRRGAVVRAADRP